jgi:hypothetical protein
MFPMISLTTLVLTSIASFVVTVVVPVALVTLRVLGRVLAGIFSFSCKLGGR